MDGTYLLPGKVAAKNAYPYQSWENLIQIKLPDFPLPVVSLMNPPLHAGSHTPFGKRVKLFLLSMPGWNEWHTSMVWPFLPQSKKPILLIQKNGNGLWQDALDRKIYNLWLAFDILNTDCNPLPGYSKASGHIIFDVRMTLELKYWWVKDGHITPDPENLTYAGVVSQVSVRIALTYDALNGLDVYTCDIQNDYLKSPSYEKNFIICGP